MSKKKKINKGAHHPHPHKRDKKNSKKDPVILNRIIYLNDIKSKLVIIARAVTGRAIEIFPAEREGGCKNDNFFLFLIKLVLE